MGSEYAVKRRYGVLCTIHRMDHMSRVLARFLGLHEMQAPLLMRRSMFLVFSPRSLLKALGMLIAITPASIPVAVWWAVK